jgi:selenoprotein W-related protein
LLEAYEQGIRSLTLIPSRGGAFEVTVNGNLVYSKLQNGRHAEPGEVRALFRKMLEEG